MFQRLLRAAAIGALVMLGSAQASEPETSRQFSWTGFYAGLHVGAGFGDADVNIPAYPSSFSESPSGAVAGGHIGYNFQSGRLVFGIEADLSFSGANDSALSGLRAELYNIEEDWRASVRGRFGLASGHSLYYGTAGWARTRLTTHYVPLAGGIDHDTIDGWTVGGGIEHAVASKLVLRLEYLYSDLGTANFFHNGPSSVDYTTQELRVGASFRF
jgi:outer membrane immunogenic protein